MSGLLHAVGQLLLFALLVIACGACLVRVARVAFASSSPRQKTSGGGKVRAALGSPASRKAITAGKTAGQSAGKSVVGAVMGARADVRRAWGQARATNWLEHQRHIRENGGTANTGGTASTGGTATATRPRRTIGRLVHFIKPAKPDDADGGASTPPGSDPYGLGGITDEEARERTRRHLEDEQRKNAGQQPQPSTTGGTTPVGTSTASAEKLIEGINEIHAHAASGGIHAKQEAIKAAHEGSVRFAAMVQMLARQLAEPGSNYGPEITEPLAQSGQHHQAAAMSLSESDAALSTLINMSVGDLATSPRQAPHHSELSENGAR